MQSSVTTCVFGLLFSSTSRVAERENACEFSIELGRTREGWSAPRRSRSSSENSSGDVNEAPASVQSSVTTCVFRLLFSLTSRVACDTIEALGAVLEEPKRPKEGADEVLEGISEGEEAKRIKLSASVCVRDADAFFLTAA